MFADRMEVKAYGTILPDMTMLMAWVKKAVKSGNPALERYVKETNDPTIERALAWSNEVNKLIGEMIYGVLPLSTPVMKRILGNYRSMKASTVYQWFVRRRLREYDNLKI